MIKYFFGCQIPVYKRSMMTFNSLTQEQSDAFITPLNNRKPKSTRWFFSEYGLYSYYQGDKYFTKTWEAVQPKLRTFYAYWFKEEKI